jgi:hypothetical protein
MISKPGHLCLSDMKREVTDEEEYMILGSHHFVILLAQCPSALEVSTSIFKTSFGLLLLGFDFVDVLSMIQLCNLK